MINKRFVILCSLGLIGLLSVLITYSDEVIKSSVELKIGYNDNLNLQDKKNKEGGRTVEGYLNIEAQIKSDNTQGSLKYNLGLVENQPLTILEEDYIFPEAGRFSYNHLLTAKLRQKLFTPLFWGIKAQGEYNDADLEGLVYQKWLIGSGIEYLISSRTNIGVEVNNAQRQYDKLTPSRIDNRQSIAASISCILPQEMLGRLEYQYLTNESNTKVYEYTGYGPLFIFSFPVSEQIDFQLISSYEIRNYEIGMDSTIFIMPSIINKRIKYMQILFEYSFQSNNSTISGREFVQNRYIGGVTINF